MSRFPIIVLDGPDGTGKSTLAQALVKELGGKYLHLTYRWPTKMFDYHTAGISQALYYADQMPVVLDRWWMSEMVYADAYRGGTKWPMGKRLFEKVALKHAITYVLCLPENKQGYLEHYNILKGKRVEMYNEGMDRVYTGFYKLSQKLIEDYRLGVMHYDFMEQGDKLDFVVQDIIALSEDIRAAQWAPALDRKFMNFTGDLSQAKYLLVGDELKPKTRREVWPFFEHGNSSLWLAEALEFAKVPEHELMFMNAFHPNNEHRVMHLIEHMIVEGIDDRMKIIALGNNASDYISALKVPHTVIKHPQYYRRFKANDGKHIVKETFDILRSNDVRSQ